MTIYHRHRVPMQVVAASFLLAATANSASAQLMGRLKKAAQDKIESSISKNAPSAKSAAKSDAASAESRLSITDARIDQLLVAMQPLVAYAEQHRAIAEAERAYRDKSKEFDACRERTAASARNAPPMSVETQVRIGEMSAEIVTVASAQSQAGMRGDVVQATALLDSMDLMAAKAQQLQYPALRACGLPARRPVPPPTERAAGDAPTPVQPTGMTAAQFGLLRERVAVYLLTEGKEDVFSADERAALAARASELAKLTPLFRDGSLEWSSWGKLAKSWSAF